MPGVSVAEGSFSQILCYGGIGEAFGFIGGGSRAAYRRVNDP
jgi:hypothetical protein